MEQWVARLEARAKGSIYCNEAGAHAPSSCGGVAPLEKHWQDDHVAFAGEANVGLVILAWSCDVRIGCQVIWMTGVAIAPDQANDDDLSFKSFMSLDVDSPV